MEVHLDAVVADIAWVTDIRICQSDERMEQVCSDHRMALILERLKSDRILVDDEKIRTVQRYCPSARVEGDVNGHGIEDEVVTVRIPPAASLLVGEYKRLLNALDDDDMLGVIRLVSVMFRMHREGLVVNAGNMTSRDRCWRPTDKAKQLAIHYGLDVPVGPLPASWRLNLSAEMDEIVSWHVNFLTANLLAGPSGPLIGLGGGDEVSKAMLISDLQRFLVQSGLAETLMSLSQSNRAFIVASSKLRRTSEWLLAGRQPTDRDTARRLFRLIRNAVLFLASAHDA
jgi:hypothetical protein